METELKLIIANSSDFRRLLQSLPAAERVVEQRNLYFVDPEGMLAKRRVMLRVREEVDVDSGQLLQVIVTSKRRLSRNAGVFVADEKEAIWDNEQWKEFCLRGQNLATFSHEFMVRLREGLGFDSLVKEGMTVNIRHRVQVENFVFELDETTFPNGVVDYEVEVETEHPEQARVLLQALATQSGITLSTQERGKYARFRASMGR
jgi:uncharacterized protein YjbK